MSLTGSDKAGAAVACDAGDNAKKSVLELGGSDPFIVLDGDRMERTVEAAAKGRLGNTGQSCVPPTASAAPCSPAVDRVAYGAL